MTTPWFPLPNPGGNARALVRKAIAAQITAQSIPGLVNVYSSLPPDWNFDQFQATGLGFKAMVAVRLEQDTEARTAYTGPTDRGGKMLHFNTTLYLEHWTTDLALAQDSDESEDDYDRIYEALKDCFRGQGRDLGRPDAGILFAGEWPRETGFTGTHEMPVNDNGSLLREGTLQFDVTQYLIQYPTS